MMRTIAIWFVLTATCFAAPPSPLSWTPGAVTIQIPVEQQTIGGASAPLDGPYITNQGLAPNGRVYVWDNDDHQTATAAQGGKLEPGQFVDYVTYVRADLVGHAFGVAAFSSDRGAQYSVILSFYDAGTGDLLFSHSASGTEGVESRVCVVGPDYNDDDTQTKWLENAACPFIAGSGVNGHHDGGANEVRVVATIYNTGSKALRHIGANFSVWTSTNIFFQQFSPTGQYPSHNNGAADPAWAWE